MISIKERFLSKTEIKNDDECWPWLGATLRDGRGSITFDGHQTTAPRISLFVFKGILVPKGLFACHKCDNPNRVNPSHLFIGTNKENIWDASHKGRISGQDKTHCKYGHILVQDSKTGSDGRTRRRCRVCDAKSKSEHDKKIKQLKKMHGLTTRATMKELEMAIDAAREAKG